MYTLDQQIKDVDKAIEILERYEENNWGIFLCSISKSISINFYRFVVRAFKRMDKISPKAYTTTVTNPLNFYIDKYGGSAPLWWSEDYQSRKQFLEDLKEDIIENG